MNNLQPSTQKEYRRILTAIEAKFGCAPIAAIADPRFVSDALEWRDEIAVSKPREADNRMIVLGRLLSWAKKRHRISANVLEGYERIYRTDRSEKIWLPEHIAVMERVASPEFLSLFLGALFTGLRQGDLRKLPWSAYDGKAITWRVTKRRKGDAGVKLTIPCLTVLRSLLDSLPRRGPLIFTTATGGLGRNDTWHVTLKLPEQRQQKRCQKLLTFISMTRAALQSRCWPRPEPQCQRSQP
jgi:integrase